MKKLILISLLLIACEKKNVLYGEIDATEIDVGVKIPGRLAEVKVSEGTPVQKDMLMAVMASPEVKAKLKTATAGKGAAQEQLNLARTTYERVEKLFSIGAVTRQQRDEARLKYQNAIQQVTASEGVVSEVSAASDETQIRSPIDGEVLQVVSNVGELVAPGYPVITVVDLKDQWVVFNVREDNLEKYKQGQVVSVQVPALKKTIPMKVSYISALGSFAVWKSTNEKGRFDLKTFEIRARPDEPVEGLRPGMTALIED